MTQSELSIAKKLKLRKDLKEEMPNLTDDAFVKENIAILHIYHENLHFIKQERGEVSKTQHPFAEAPLEGGQGGSIDPPRILENIRKE